MFSNVMEIKIIAYNTNPVPLHEVVMDLKVLPVSIKSFWAQGLGRDRCIVTCRSHEHWSKYIAALYFQGFSRIKCSGYDA